MKQLLKYILPAIIVGFAVTASAHAQVASPNFFRKIGNNVYPLVPASTTIGTSTALGQFGTLTDASGNKYSTSTVTSSSIQAALPDSIHANNLTVTSTLLAGTISPNNIQGFIYFPTPAQLAAGAKCGTTAGVTEVGACMSDIVTASASGTIVEVGPYNYPSSTWTTPWNFTTNQTFVTVLCVPNVSTFNWGGNGTSTIWNYGSSASASGYTAHASGVGPLFCTFYGPSANGTTTWASLGGSQGAEGFMAWNNRIQGFGLWIQTGDNVWVPNIEFNQVIDVGQAFNAPGGTSNAGERFNITHNIFSDQDSLPTGSQRTSSSLEHFFDFQNVTGLNFCNNSIDDGGVTFESAVQGANYCNNYMENPGVAHNSAYPAYHYVTVVPSANNSVNISGLTVRQDATSTEATGTANAFIANGGALNINGLTAVANAGNSATTTKYLVIETASTSQLQATGIMNTSGTAFSYLDQMAPTSTLGLQVPYGSVGSTTAAFSVATGTISGTINYLTGMQSGKVTWVAANTGGTQDIITFARAFNVEPVCTMTSASGTNATSIIRSQRVTTTTLTFADSSAFATSSAWDFICVGNPN